MRKLILCLAVSLAGRAGAQSPGRSLSLSAYGPPADSAACVTRDLFWVPHIIDADACVM